MKIISTEKKSKNDKLVFISSIILSLYIIFMISSYRLGFDSMVIIGVFRELLDLPAFALLAIFFVLSVISFVKDKFKFASYPFYSIIILLIAALSLFLFVWSLLSSISVWKFWITATQSHGCHRVFQLCSSVSPCRSGSNWNTSACFDPDQRANLGLCR